MFLTLLITLTILLLSWKLIQQHLKFKNIPRPYPQIPFVGGTFGHSSVLIRKAQPELYDLHQRYGPIMLVGPIGLPELVIADPVEIKRIHNDSRLFPRSDFLEYLLVGVLNYGLAYLPSGSLHKKHRKILQPAFAPIHLRQVPSACERVFETVVAKWGSSGTLDFSEEMLKVALDVLGVIAFGSDFGAVEGKLESTKLWSGLEDFLAFDIMLYRIIFPRFMWDYVGVGPNSTKFNAKVKQYTDFFDEFIDSSEIASKLENYNDDSKFELNFMERLIVALRQGKLSREELHHECLTFISAGHETSSHTLTFLIWDLCVHPELQEELYETVKNINDLNSLPPLDLLDRVLRESQRLHSIVTGSTSRLAAEDTIICGFQIPKGTNFQLSYRAVHLNPTYYPSPLKFNPDRWLDPKTMKQPFFPFGGGEHACIGQKLSLLEVKSLMICFLQKYKFSMSKKGMEEVVVDQPFTLKCNPQIQFVERL